MHEPRARMVQGKRQMDALSSPRLSGSTWDEGYYKLGPLHILEEGAEGNIPGEERTSQ